MSAVLELGECELRRGFRRADARRAIDEPGLTESATPRAAAGRLDARTVVDGGVGDDRSFRIRRIFDIFDKCLFYFILQRRNIDAVYS